MGHQLLTCDDPPRRDRSCHIRVGANTDGNGTLGPILYTADNHASIGILSVTKDPDTYDIIVTSDWGTGEESCGFSADHDLQLAAKGVLVGCSGGATTTRVRMYATRTLPRYPGTSSSEVWAAGAQLPPHGSWAGTYANFALTLKSVIPAA